MNNRKDILQNINDIEEEWFSGETDIQDATHRVGQALENYVDTDDAVIHFKDFKIPEGNNINHIKTGIGELDEIVGGFGKGDLHLISGDTGDGKTTFSRFLIRKFSEQGKKCLVFSYEETNAEFLSKFKGELPDGYIPKVLTAKSTTWIEAKILEAVELFGVEIVFIDNLKGIIDHESRRSEVGEVDAIIQRLKAIAIKYNIVLFLLAHIKKLDSGLIDKNSLTGSKSIVDTASIGLALRRLPDTQEDDEDQNNRKKQKGKKAIENTGIKYTNYTSFYLIKNRYNGQYKDFTLLFHPESGLYTEKTQDSIVSKDDIKIEF